MDSVEQYYREKDERWALPDEDWDDYLCRRQQSSTMSGIDAFSSNPFEQPVARPNPTPAAREDVALQLVEGPSSVRRSMKHEITPISRDPPEPGLSKRNSAEQEGTSAPLDTRATKKRRVEEPSTNQQPASNRGAPSRTHASPTSRQFQPATPHDGDGEPSSPSPPLNPTSTSPIVAFTSSPAADNAGSSPPSAAARPRTPSSPIQDVSAFTDPPHRRTPPRKRPRLVETSTITTPGNASVLPVPVPAPGPSRQQFKAMRMRPPPPPPAAPKVAKTKSKSKAKEKPEPRTPVQFARELAERPVPSSTAPILKGFKIFYVGGDPRSAIASTRNRMSYIHAGGGTVVPEFDPAEVTHIISATNERLTLHALGLEKLDDIPEHIPVLNWDWALSAKRVREADGSVRTKMDHEFMHACFAKRIPPVKNDMGPPKDKGKRKDDEGGGGGARRASSSGSVAPQPRKPGDPLAEFEDLAKAELAAESAEVATATSISLSSKNPKLKGFLCDRPAESAKVDECVNQDVIDKLSELTELHRAKQSDDDKWRVFSYSKAIRALKAYPHRITSEKQARSINGVGDKTATKIMEIINTGELRRIAAERTEDVQVAKVLSGIYGVGPQVAYSWYRAGCRTLDDVRDRKGGIKLSSVQEIGLEFYDDINTRMPRDEARAIFDAIKPIALSLDADLFIEIMGSYRR
ncbi:hypothetical protein OF83DRAFT_1157963, partial [Amylostereum chailletii]